MTPQERDKLIYRSWRVYIQLSEVQVSFEASMDFRAAGLDDDRLCNVSESVSFAIRGTAGMTGSLKTFRITKEDLAALERAVPIMHDAISNMPPVYFRPDVQVAMEEAKRVLSDVRWDNGPFLSIERIAP